MKKIVCITGSRAEYGVMKYLLKMLDKDPSFELSLIVTGMHLMKKFGKTIDIIKKDGFKIKAEINMKLDDNTNEGMSKSLGYAIIGITDALKRIKPDLVIMAGDRGEILAAAIAASHLNIPVAHISGGDTTTGATIDERIRHAITKFADIHFPANENSAKVIIGLGENPKFVFTVGNPGIPVKYELNKKKRIKIAGKYGLNQTKPIILVLQHPCTTQVSSSDSQMRETMEAVKELKQQTIIIYPNTDAGSKAMIKVIHEFAYLNFIQIHKNVERDDFQDLMALSDVMIGNSSCALLEGPSFNLPAVDIGKRQEGREHADNIIHVNHNKEEIIKAVRIALSEEFQNKVKKSVSPYAKESPEYNITKILKEINWQQARKNKFKKND